VKEMTEKQKFLLFVIASLSELAGQWKGDGSPLVGKARRCLMYFGSFMNWAREKIMPTP
jgi:hypothetical protein